MLCQSRNRGVLRLCQVDRVRISIESNDIARVKAFRGCMRTPRIPMEMKNVQIANRTRILDRLLYASPALVCGCSSTVRSPAIFPRDFPK